MELRWWSIEVLDGSTWSARGWRDSLGNALTEAAISHGAYEWQWHEHTWGVLFEIAFASDERWTGFRNLPLVTAALDGVPDPVHGLFVYPGRGGSNGQRHPRRPRPIAGAGAAPLPETTEVVPVAHAESHPPTGVASAA
jgi:hypothetical protein